MIELLGIGVESASGVWLFRRASARLEAGELTVVVSAWREVRTALLDAVSARRIPIEGRVWIDAVPVSPETVVAVRARVGTVDLTGRLAEHRSLLWNVLLAPGQRPEAMRTGLRLTSPSVRALAVKALRSVGLEKRAREPLLALDLPSRRRLLVARALVRMPRCLIVPEVDHGLSLSAAGEVLGLLRTLAQVEGMTVLVSAMHPTLIQTFAHRVLDVTPGGAVVASRPGGPPGDALGSRRSWPRPAEQPVG